jgi:hypothetical protein
MSQTVLAVMACFTRAVLPAMRGLGYCLCVVGAGLVGYAFVLTAKLLYFVLEKAKMIQTDVPRHVPFA